MNSYLLFISMAWSNSEPETTSQDTESTPSTEDAKENTTDADNDNGSTKEVQSSDKPSKKTNSFGSNG